jgi:shikimate 5-dehydrogenase
VIINTIPPEIDLSLPSELFSSQPIVVDTNYIPAMTSLLEQAKSQGCPILQGSTILLEQSIEQFHLWQERSAPRMEMEETLLKCIPKIDSLL